MHKCLSKRLLAGIFKEVFLRCHAIDGELCQASELLGLLTAPVILLLPPSRRISESPNDASKAFFICRSFLLYSDKCTINRKPGQTFSAAVAAFISFHFYASNAHKCTKLRHEYDWRDYSSHDCFRPRRFYLPPRAPPRSPPRCVRAYEMHRGFRRTRRGVRQFSCR